MFLLPTTAQAFKSRPTPIVVTDNCRRPFWLKHTLNRIRRENKDTHPLMTATHYQDYLISLLDKRSAIWTLALVRSSDIQTGELREDFGEGKPMSIRGYVVHVDLVLNNEIVFKLTPQTIDALIKHHQEFDGDCGLDDGGIPDGAQEKTATTHCGFGLAVNRFVCGVDARALNRMRSDGSGEVHRSMGIAVRRAIAALFSNKMDERVELYSEALPTAETPLQQRGSEVTETAYGVHENPDPFATGWYQGPAVEMPSMLDVFWWR